MGVNMDNVTDVVDLFEVEPSRKVHSPNLGGRREGSGRMKKETAERVKHAIDEDGGVDYAVARARKEDWLAKTVELDYRIKQGEYVNRDKVRQVCATAFSAIAQALRSIPDGLERKEGIQPQLADKISIYIDEAMSSLSHDFEKLAGDQ